jgi:RNA polymerase sigma factor (sigma-70 family)
MQTAALPLQDSCLLPVAGDQGFSAPASPERRMEFETVLSRYLPRFRRMAMRWLPNPEDAEDAVQDALLSAFKHIARFEGRAQMSTWLMAIVCNAVRMQLRRRPRYKILSLDQLQQDDQGTISDQIADPRPTPEQTLEQCELRQLALRLTRSLPPSQRAAIELRQGDDLSTRQAAEALGLREGTLKTQLARGRAKLMEQLRKAVGVSRTRTSSRDSKARRKAPPSVGCRRDLAQGSPTLPSVGS